MTAFYNELDPYAATWLENLITAGLIAPGIVDRRKIQDIEAWELLEFTQCHFFAGIGIWSGALRAAGWPDDRPIWTGSCPCQPFSNAGQRKGTADDRHLWPYWIKLIEQCQPAIIVGEQVASKDGLGWLDLVSSDMERAGYAIGASDLCAAGFGQAHLRQRLYFVGLDNSTGARHIGTVGKSESDSWHEARLCLSGAGCEDDTAIGLADPSREGGSGWGIQGYGESDSESLRTARERSSGLGEDNGMAGRSVRNSREAGSLDNADWLLCRNPAGEPSWRPVESGTFPLAHGITGRVGRLRAYGNALDFATAQGFCEAVAEIAGIRLVTEYDL